MEPKAVYSVSKTSCPPPTLSENSPFLAHRRAASAWRMGNSAQWVTAFYAARVVGLGAKGETLALAADIARSADTVERLAHAALAYRFLFRHGAADTECRNKLRQARRRLSYLHFDVAWKAISREMEPKDILADILVAADEGTGVRMLAMALAGRVGEGTKKDLGAGEFELPTWEPESELYRQALGTGNFRVVLVDKNAETVIVRYP